MGMDLLVRGVDGDSIRISGLLFVHMKKVAADETGELDYCGALSRAQVHRLWGSIVNQIQDGIPLTDRETGRLFVNVQSLIQARKLCDVAAELMIWLDKTRDTPDATMTWG